MFGSAEQTLLPIISRQGEYSQGNISGEPTNGEIVLYYKDNGQPKFINPLFTECSREAELWALKERELRN